MAPPSLGPTSFWVASGVAGSARVKATSSPLALRKPILILPWMVSSRTWSGMSARNSTVTSPLATLDRSAYSLPLMLMLSAAKLSLPMTRNFPSVLNRTTISPLNSSFDV